MKKNFACLIFVAILSLISGCSKQTITQPDKEEQKFGSVLFKIDKTNAPKEVVEIIASLSRDGYDTLKSSMNLLTDSTADLTINGIDEGTWHLRVDAKNSLQKIIYSGEADVEVQEGVTVQVSLTLLPTGIGTGNIYIMVNWGNLADKWIDYAQNPIFTSTQTSANPPYGLASAKILFDKDDGNYKMWYTNTFDNAKTNIGYAESNDGIQWTNINSNVLDASESGCWDDYSVGAGAIIKEGGTYKLYYNGWHNQYEKKHIGLATSTDGIHWEKYSTPIIFADDNELQIWATDIVKKDGTYYLYYCSSSYKIYLATSTDGINFTKYQSNPILVYSQTWESYGVFSPSVIYDNNTFKMIYMDPYNSSFGKAVSNDGKNWTKSPSNPIFTTESTAGGWANKIRNPFVRKFNNSYKLFYSGSDYNNFSVALATNNIF